MLENRRNFDYLRKPIDPETEWIRPGRDPIGARLRSYRRVLLIELKLWHQTYLDYRETMGGRTVRQREADNANVLGFTEGIRRVRENQSNSSKSSP